MVVGASCFCHFVALARPPTQPNPQTSIMQLKIRRGNTHMLGKDMVWTLKIRTDCEEVQALMYSPQPLSVCALRPSHFAYVVVGFQVIIKCHYEDMVNSQKTESKGAFWKQDSISISTLYQNCQPCQTKKMVGIHRPWGAT